jgi:hypothetical protein
MLSTCSKIVTQRSISRVARLAQRSTSGLLGSGRFAPARFYSLLTSSNADSSPFAQVAQNANMDTGPATHPHARPTHFATSASCPRDPHHAPARIHRRGEVRGQLAPEGQQTPGQARLGEAKPAGRAASARGGGRRGSQGGGQRGGQEGGEVLGRNGPAADPPRHAGAAAAATGAGVERLWLAHRRVQHPVRARSPRPAQSARKARDPALAPAFQRLRPCRDGSLPVCRHACCVLLACQSAVISCAGPRADKLISDGPSLIIGDG